MVSAQANQPCGTGFQPVECGTGFQPVNIRDASPPRPPLTDRQARPSSGAAPPYSPNRRREQIISRISRFPYSETSGFGRAYVLGVESFARGSRDSHPDRAGSTRFFSRQSSILPRNRPEGDRAGDSPALTAPRECKNTFFCEGLAEDRALL